MGFSAMGWPAAGYEGLRFRAFRSTSPPVDLTGTRRQPAAPAVNLPLVRYLGNKVGTGWRAVIHCGVRPTGPTQPGTSAGWQPRLSHGTTNTWSRGLARVMEHCAGGLPSASLAYSRPSRCHGKEYRLGLCPSPRSGLPA